jgi:prepilin-type N-terminal cleavage/methylation domain-containing protein
LVFQRKIKIFIFIVCPTMTEYSKIEKGISLMSIIKRNKQKGFTLIELMVTIAIVGLLVVIALVAFSGQTDKARIAKTLQWSRSIEHLLGADAVGIWTFDEGSGTTAIDSSGYGNDGTINGASYTTDTPSGYGYALEFDDTNNDVVNIPVISFSDSDTWSFSHWINWEGQNDCYVFYAGSGNGSKNLLLRHSSNNRFAFRSASTGYAFFPSNSSNDIISKYTYLSWVADGSGNISLYVNEEILGTLNSVGTAIDFSFLGRGYSSRSYVSFPNDTYYLKGKLDDVRIYETALTSAQVEALYYAGLDNLYNKNLIDKQEYRERILANNK